MTDLETQIRKVIPTLQGWTSPEKALLLANTVYDNKLYNCIELGVYGGMSALPVAMALKALNKGSIYCVDPWKVEASIAGQDEINAKWWSELDHNSIYAGFLEAVRYNQLRLQVIVERLTSEEMYAQMDKNERFDYVNIDANHSIEKSTWDVEHYVPLVRSGGYIWQDDLIWQGSDAAYQKMLTLGVEEICREGTGALFRKK